MTGEEMERAIEFLIDHHAKVSADIERHSEQIAELTASVKGMRRETERHSEQIGELTASVKLMQQDMEANRVEVRAAIDNLIVANEVTRKLSEDVAKLIVQNSQRITRLEEKAS